MNNQSLKHVMETTHLGVVLTNDLSCANDVERAKSAFFKQFNSVFYKFNFVHKNLLLHIFRLHALSLYIAETWYKKLTKGDLKTFQCHIKKLSNVPVKEILMIVSMSALSK